MKKPWLFSATLAILSLFPLSLRAAAPEIAATPQGCATASVTLAEIFAPAPHPVSSCYASETCPNSSTISCSCPGSGVCTSSGTSVSCDCTPDPDYYFTCQECTPGQEKQEPAGCCTPYKGRLQWYVCNSSGMWEPTPYYMCYGPCDPLE